MKTSFEQRKPQNPFVGYMNFNKKFQKFQPISKRFEEEEHKGKRKIRDEEDVYLEVWRFEI
jgi:hypothetical protein